MKHVKVVSITIRDNTELSIEIPTILVEQGALANWYEEYSKRRP